MRYTVLSIYHLITSELMSQGAQEYVKQRKGVPPMECQCLMLLKPLSAIFRYVHRTLYPYPIAKDHLLCSPCFITNFSYEVDT